MSKLKCIVLLSNSLINDNCKNVTLKSMFMAVGRIKKFCKTKMFCSYENQVIKIQCVSYKFIN